MLSEHLHQILMITGVVLSALMMLFFSGMSTALVSVNRLNVELRRNQGTTEGLLMGGFIDERHLFISTCYFGMVISLMVQVVCLNGLSYFMWNPNITDSPYIMLTVNVVLSNLIMGFFGKFMGRVLFNRNDRLLYALLPLFSFFYNVFNPIINLLQTFGNGILTYLFNVRIHPERKGFDASVPIQKNYLVNDGDDDKVAQTEINTHLFENALFLPSIKIRQSLTPRTEIEGLEIKTNVNAAREKIIYYGLDKMVVYDDNIDNILGYILMSDLFKNPPDLQSILLPVFIVPETKSVTDLLYRFSQERKGIAWVIDEFGGTAGIISVDNIIRELFGDTKGSFGKSNYVESKISEDEFIFSGRMELSRLNERYDFDFPEKESETLSGYIIRENKRIPKEKERVIIDNYVFDIISVTDRKINLIKLKVLR